MTGISLQLQWLEPNEIDSLSSNELRAIGRFLEREEWPSLARDIQSKNVGRSILIAFLGKTIIGFLEGSFTDLYSEEWRTREQSGSQGWIYSIIISSKHRRMGYGRLMIREYAGKARASGCSYIGLEINPRGSAQARNAFFDSLGFVRVPYDSGIIAVCSVDRLLPV